MEFYNHNLIKFDKIFTANLEYLILLHHIRLVIEKVCSSLYYTNLQFIILKMDKEKARTFYGSCPLA